MEDYKKKVYGQTNKTFLLISNLIFTIICGTFMILFDAFATKSLHVCLPVSFRLMDLVLGDREDSAKKEFYRQTL